MTRDQVNALTDIRVLIEIIKGMSLSERLKLAESISRHYREEVYPHLYDDSPDNEYHTWILTFDPSILAPLVGEAITGESQKGNEMRTKLESLSHPADLVEELREIFRKDTNLTLPEILQNILSHLQDKGWKSPTPSGEAYRRTMEEGRSIEFKNYILYDEWVETRANEIQTQLDKGGKDESH